MLNIEAILSVTPTSYKCQIPDNLIITRGATATLTFDLSNKPYTFEDVDQITFVLKQGQTIYWYKMFTYLLPTQDVVVVPGKEYYQNVNRLNNTLQCEAELVVNPLGNPMAQGYYEEVDGSSNWRNTKHIFDPHFSYTAIEDLKYVTLVLSASDTLDFNAKSNKPVELEVAIRLNTEDIQGYDKQDAIIIETLPPMGVIDSLFSKI